MHVYGTLAKALTLARDGGVVDRNVINKNKGPSSPYGIIRINDIVDYTGVDLLEVAEELLDCHYNRTNKVY